MSSTPPIVPSRNALRALRRLAYGGSTIIGAVGSVFTVAGVSYDTQRRVGLAERFIETKRTIKSVSNSSGAAHVARMFEAAEKGEDFGLGITGPRQRNANREYSALANDGAQLRRPPEAEPLGSHLPWGKDDKRDENQAETASGSQKKAARPLQGRPRPRQKSPFSSELAKRLLADSPSGQCQLVQQASRKSATPNDRHESYKLAQAGMELPHTIAPGAAQSPVRDYPAVGDILDTKGSSSGRRTRHLPHASDLRRDFDSNPGKEHDAVQRILASTLQQHKLHDHGAYGRPGKDHEAQWVVADASPHKTNSAKTNSSAAEKTVAATQQQHKLHSHGVYGRPAKASTEFHVRLNEHVALWLSGACIPEDHSSVERNRRSQTGFPLGREGAPTRPGSPSLGGTPYVKHLRRHLSALTRDADTYIWRPIGGHQSREQKGSQQYPFSLSKKQVTALERNGPSQSDRGNVYSRKQRKQNTSSIVLDLRFEPWPLSTSTGADVSKISVMDSLPTQPSESRIAHTQQTALSIDNDLSEQSSLEHERNPQLEQGYGRSNGDSNLRVGKSLEEIVAASKQEGFAVWHDNIRAAIKKHGTVAARQLWLDAMAYYGAPGNSLDWKMVDALHTHFHQKFWTAKSPYFDFYPGRLLTRHVLQTDPMSQRAAALVFPLVDRETELEAEYAAKGMIYPTKQRSRNVFANAGKYLQDCWDQDPNAEKIIPELRKIIRLAQMHNIELAEELFFGTVRRLSSNGQVEQAQVLFDEMVYYHGIEPSFLTRSVLVCGHARTGDWDRVAKEIEAMHNVHDLSRREPLGYSLMFNDVLVEYASRRSIAQTHDFLVHALGYWGLVPTSAISATAIQAFLTHRRYDLVREWIETVRVLFPQVDIETSRFAWHLGSVFEDINASCVEIEEACKALCYRKDASKVQACVREMVRLALARDLATKLHAAEVAQAGSPKQDAFPTSSPWALDHLLERAQSFAPDSSPEGDSQSTQSPEAHELLIQVEAVARLTKFFGTNGKYRHTPSTNVNEPSQPRSLEKRSAPVQITPFQSNVPTELMRDLLPTLPEIERLLKEYYTSRQDAGLPISHVVLKYTCQKLRKHDRRVDVMQLLKATFDGPYVRGPTGIMFDLSIMEMWLRCAYETKSLAHCLTVFWAVLDAGEDYLLTSKFVLLANMCSHKVRKNRFAELVVTNPSKYKELEYLVDRLRRKLWDKKEGAGPNADKSRGVEYRKMKQEMRRRLVLRTPRTVEAIG